MGCVWFIHKRMELHYLLVHGNVKNSRINGLNGKVFFDTFRIMIKRPNLNTNFVLKLCGFPCYLMYAGKVPGLRFVA